MLYSFSSPLSTVSTLAGSVCLWVINGGFKQDSVLPQRYQKLTEYSMVLCALVSHQGAINLGVSH